MITLKQFFRKLRSFLKKPPHDYIPSTMPFLELDIEKMKRDMNLVEIGRKRGEKNEPSYDSISLDDIEQKIITSIESEKKRSYQNYIDNLKTYADRLRSLDFETRISSIEQSARNAIAEFSTQVHNGKDQLYHLRRSVIEIGREEEAFRKKHGLNRTADFPDSRVFHYSIIILLSIVEIPFNSYFLARGSEFGLLGGYMEALLITGLNVVIGFLIGKSMVPNIFHRHLFRKIIGWVCTISFIFFVFGFNLVVGHYRDALGGEFPEKAASIILDNLINTPFIFADFKSWLMILVGIVFAIVAAYDGFKTDDPYPGYGSITRRRSNIVQDYAESKEDLIEELRDTKDYAIDSMKQAKEDVEKRKKEYYSVIDAREHMKGSFHQHLEYLERCANNLLSEYREVNKHYRTLDPPAHFSELWEITYPPPATFGHTVTVNDNELKRASASLDSHVKELLNEYEKAVEKYKQIGQLTLEDF